MITKNDIIKKIKSFGYNQVTIEDEENLVETFKRFNRMASKFLNANSKHRSILNKQYWDEIWASNGKLNQ